MEAPRRWRDGAPRSTGSSPKPAELAGRARELIASPPPEAKPVDLNSPQTSPLRSVNSSNLVDILDQLGSSLMVTTYQTGKLVCIRKDGTGVNTHFRQFESPMGLDLRGGRLAIGTRSQVFEYHNVPSVAAKLEPAGKYDACFVPRRSHYTGDIRIHELAYAGDELWFVNTRFSCLATLDQDHSFVPRWRPPFIKALAAEDRCHLNGMAVVDDEVRYVSMLGASDEAGGWRENKASGGLIMDVPSSEPVIGGLSMPHSPRWYRDQLWVLESGEGAIGRVDLDTGKVETVAKLPGFTRGLSFMGPLAFIGLSEVRESSTFGGLPLTGRLEERQCGVWVVNIETGRHHRLPPLRGPRRGDLRRDGPPRHPLPRGGRARLRRGQPDLRGAGRGVAGDGLAAPSPLATKGAFCSVTEQIRPSLRPPTETWAIRHRLARHSTHSFPISSSDRLHHR